MKKSNREGTGKTHKCNNCDEQIPTYKKYCNRVCYNNKCNIDITCLGCGIIKKVPKNKSSQIYCSKVCMNKNVDRKLSNKKAQQTLIDKYNTTNPFEIKGYNNIIRNTDYGNKLSKIYKSKSKIEKDLIKDKISKKLNNKTTQEKTDINNKRINTNKNRYGVTNQLNKDSKYRKSIDEKNTKSYVNKLKKWLLTNNLELMDNFDGVKTQEGELKYYNFKHIPSNTIFTDHVACGRLPIYKDPNETIGISNLEKELQDYIKTLIDKNKIIFNNKKLVKGLEIDIYIPSHKLAIEFDGLYWHSELKGKGKEYHLYKTEECIKQGIHLIHVFEDEWRYKKDIVKSRIKNHLKLTSKRIFARKCIIKEINNKDKNIFLNSNHIQGEDKSKFKYGLFFNEELVSIITFGKLRKITGNKDKEGEYELIRFCNKLDTNVIGAFSRLLKHFIKTQKPTNIISYADRRWSNGNVYIKNGFNFIHNTSPNYWYMKNFNIREHRYKYRKSELNKYLNNFNPNKSEWVNMTENNYARIWDCGSGKYELKINHI